MPADGLYHRVLEYLQTIDDQLWVLLCMRPALEESIPKQLGIFFFKMQIYFV